MGLYEEWLDVRAREQEFRDRRKELQSKLLADMGGDKAQLTYQGKLLTLTPVTGVRVEWDKAGVRDALTPALRKRLCELVLDSDRFAAAIKSGEIDASKFEEFRKVSPIDPYIRVSTKA